MCRFIHFLFIAFLAGNTAVCQQRKPNIILIYTDDLGYGDLSCYGSELIQTPVLDRLARDGMRFTDFYAPAPICSPSRAGLLTGRYPVRLGLNDVFFPESWSGLTDTVLTLPQLLKQAGYTTAMVGKWHLGHHKEYLPLQRGFDTYFGIPYSNDMAGLVYIQGNEVLTEAVNQSRMTQRFTLESAQMIKDFHKQKRPFFLYLAHAMPHVPVYASSEFAGKSKAGLYGDAVQEIDASTGELLKLLDALKLTDNTIVIFTSDNGPWLAFGKDGGSAKPLRSGKQFTFDGGMRVPMIVRWPGKIKPGTVNTSVSSQLDLMPTLAHLAGTQSVLKSDGVDISSQWLQNKQETEREFAYYSMGKLEAYRSGDWKIKLPYPGNAAYWWKTAESAHDTLLFNIRKDPGETHNEFKHNAPKAKEMMLKIQAFQQRMGKLPPSIVTRIEADESHKKRQLEAEKSK